MNASTFVSMAFPATAMAAIGFAFGRAYFAALRRSVELLAMRRGAFVPAALTLARVALATTVFLIAARLGATALLAMLAGFLAARTVAVRIRRSTA